MPSSPDSFSPVQRFIRLLRLDIKDVTNIYVFAIFSGLLSLSLPLGIQAIINLIMGGRISTSWILLVVLVVISVAVSGVLQIYQLRIVENLQQKFYAKATFEFAYRIPRMKMEALNDHHAPELVNRYFDIMGVQKGLPKLLISFTAASLQIIFGLILLSIYHPFFIAFSLILVVIVYVIFRLTAKPALETNLTESKHKYKTAHWLEEIARTIATFKISGKTILPLQKADVHIKKYLDAREEHFKILVRQYALMISFKVIIVAGLLAIGGILVMEQVMNIGQFVAAEIIILLIVGSVEKLIENLEVIYDTLTSIEKVGQIFDIEIEDVQGLEFKVAEKGMDLELKNFSFKYPKTDKFVLSDINLKINACEKVVINGQNSSGKSTLMHILSGIYDLSQGGVSFNGLPIKNLNHETFRSHVGAYMSDSLLFEGTVLENISMGREQIEFDNVKTVVDKLLLTEYIKSLPEGYNTVIKPLGKKISSSLQKKLLLARSIVNMPQLLLMEYPIEDFDLNTQMLYIDYLTDKNTCWTLIATTQNEYFAKKADKVVIVDEGKIKAIGTYEEVKHLATFY